MQAKINTTLYKGDLSNMLPKTKPGMSFSPRNLTPRNFSKREEAQVERPSQVSALRYLKWVQGEELRVCSYTYLGLHPCLCPLMAVTLSKLLNPSQSQFLYL